LIVVRSGRRSSGRSLPLGAKIPDNGAGKEKNQPIRAKNAAKSAGEVKNQSFGAKNAKFGAKQKFRAVKRKAASGS